MAEGTQAIQTNSATAANLAAGIAAGSSVLGQEGSISKDNVGNYEAKDGFHNAVDLEAGGVAAASSMLSTYIQNIQTIDTAFVAADAKVQSIINDWNLPSPDPNATKPSKKTGKK